MSLGENIVRLRTEKRQPQEELADLLGVSRQSVSKWESDVSVPELDKLIKLSEVFAVTMDKLVKGNNITIETTDGTGRDRSKGEEPTPFLDATPSQQTKPTRGNRTGGVLYLCLGFVLLTWLTLYAGTGGFVIGFIFALPFLVCGLICLLATGKRTALWCGWALYILTDGYLRYATGLTWHAIFATPYWTPQMNYMRLFIAWMQFLAIVLLVMVTMLSYRREPLALDNKAKTLYIIGWITLAAVWFSWGLVNQLYWAAIGPNRVGAQFYTLLYLLRDVIFWALLTALLTASLRLWNGKRERRFETKR